MINLTIEDIGINGEGIAKKDDNIFFVAKTLIGENVDVQILKTQKNLHFCSAKKITNLSPFRREPKCKYYDICGGCNLQHTTYEEGLKIKKNALQTTLRKAGVNAKIEDVVASKNMYGYRNKITLAVQYKNGKVEVGLKEENSHNIVEIEKCEIVNPKLNELIKLSKDLISKNNIKGYNDKTKTGLRYIVGMIVEDEMLVTLVGANEDKKLIECFSKALEGKEKVGLYFNKNTKKEIFSNDFRHIKGLKNLTGHFAEITYPISPYSFMQVNEDIKRKIYTEVLENIDSEIVIDSYSGAGLMTAMVSKKCEKAVGIEINKSATLDADKLAKDNGITNMENINGDCAKVIKELAKEDKTYSVIIDPPRAGAEEVVLESIIKLSPEQIIYVSCNPATLARDLKILTKEYKIKKIIPYDMFCWTKHLETLVVLTK